MASGPFEYRFKVRCILNLQRSCIMKRCIMDNPDGLPSNLITQRKEMREVVFTECGIILLQSFDTFILLCLAFSGQLRSIGERLYLAAVFLPLFEGLLSLCCCHVYSSALGAILSKWIQDRMTHDPGSIC